MLTFQTSYSSPYRSRLGGAAFSLVRLALVVLLALGLLASACTNDSGQSNRTRAGSEPGTRDLIDDQETATCPFLVVAGDLSLAGVPVGSLTLDELPDSPRLRTCGVAPGDGSTVVAAYYLGPGPPGELGGESSVIDDGEIETVLSIQSVPTGTRDRSIVQARSHNGADTLVLGLFDGTLDAEGLDEFLRDAHTIAVRVLSEPPPGGTLDTREANGAEESRL